MSSLSKSQCGKQGREEVDDKIQPIVGCKRALQISNLTISIVGCPEKQRQAIRDALTARAMNPLGKRLGASY